MLSKTDQSGFSLIEAMVATLIMSVSFAGVYTLTSFATTSLKSSVDRQKMQLVANQMLEVIGNDISNIDNYNLDFTTCTAPVGGETQDYHINRYKWCRMLNDSVGNPAAGDVREISVTTSGTNKIVHIILESRNGAAQIVIKNVYDQ